MKENEELEIKIVDETGNELKKMDFEKDLNGVTRIIEPRAYTPEYYSGIKWKRLRYQFSRSIILKNRDRKINIIYDVSPLIAYSSESWRIKSDDYNFHESEFNYENKINEKYFSNMKSDHDYISQKCSRYFESEKYFDIVIKIQFNIGERDIFDYVYDKLFEKNIFEGKIIFEMKSNNNKFMETEVISNEFETKISNSKIIFSKINNIKLISESEINDCDLKDCSEILSSSISETIIKKSIFKNKIESSIVEKSNLVNTNMFHSKLNNCKFIGDNFKINIKSDAKNEDKNEDMFQIQNFNVIGAEFISNNLCNAIVVSNSKINNCVLNVLNSESKATLNIDDCNIQDCDNITLQGKLISFIKSTIKKSTIKNYSILNKSNISNSILTDSVDDPITTVSDNIYDSEISNSYVLDSVINNLNLAKSTIISSKINTEENSRIQVENSKIVDSCISGYLSNISNSFILDVEKIILGNSKKMERSLINYSILESILNPQIINGRVMIENSKISERVILSNASGEKMEIISSLLEQDCVVGNSAKIINCEFKGNSSIFLNARITGNSPFKFITTNTTNNIDDVEYHNISMNEVSSKNNDDTVRISGYTKIYDFASINNNAKISGFVNIYGESELEDEPTIYGRVNILDDARVSGKAKIYKEEIINKYDERYE